jgi:hypothetical protein
MTTGPPDDPLGDRLRVLRGGLAPTPLVPLHADGLDLFTKLSYTAAVGVRFAPVIDPLCNRSTEAFLRALCPVVDRVTEPGGSTGSVHHAIRGYFAARPVPRRTPTVAFLSADRGHAYADTVYNPARVETLHTGEPYPAAA